MPLQFGIDTSSMWDVVSQRRIELEYLAAANKPREDFIGDFLLIRNAWALLPSGCLHKPLDCQALMTNAAVIQHDQRFTDNDDCRRRFCRIDCETNETPESKPLLRATQLLKAMFGKWQAFASSIDWSNTHVVLFTPTEVNAQLWLQTVLTTWPQDIAARGYSVANGDVESWVENQLLKNSGPEHLLCLSIDSWVTSAGLLMSKSDDALGESIAALSLRRASRCTSKEIGEGRLHPAQRKQHEPRKMQGRLHTADLDALVEQLGQQSDTDMAKIAGVVTDGLVKDSRASQLNAFMQAHFGVIELSERAVGVSDLSAHVGHCATVIAQLAIAYWLAIESAEDGTLVLDRYRASTTAGWLLTHAPQQL